MSATDVIASMHMDVGQARQGERPADLLQKISTSITTVHMQAPAVGDAGAAVRLDPPAVRPRGRRAAAAAVPAGRSHARRGGRGKGDTWVEYILLCQVVFHAADVMTVCTLILILARNTVKFIFI